MQIGKSKQYIRIAVVSLAALGLWLARTESLTACCAAPAPERLILDEVTVTKLQLLSTDEPSEDVSISCEIFSYSESSHQISLECKKGEEAVSVTLEKKS